MKNLPAQTQSMLQLQILQLFFNVEYPGVLSQASPTPILLPVSQQQLEELTLDPTSQAVSTHVNPTALNYVDQEWTVPIADATLKKIYTLYV